MSLPKNTPGVLIVQHMPESFTHAYAERLNKMCLLEVREAKDNDHVKPGVALIAPGDRHMILSQSRGKNVVKIKEGPPVNYQRPSVDVLFQSVARCAGENAMGVLLTGMGADGAKGMLALYERGAYTIAQDEESCVVFGMPREAIKLGAVDKVVSLQEIPRTIIKASDNPLIKPRVKRL
jgi:two-component system chemotaxis response regulator CheB